METITDKEACRQEAYQLGFSECGFTDIEPSLRTEYYERWISEGKHGGMEWMERNNDRRLRPANILKGAQSIVCLGYNYYQEEPNRRGRIAKYALGKDYHKVLIKKLKALCRWMQTQGGDQKPYVDTGPVLEKPIAAQSGIGWQAKNTLLLSKNAGPYLMIGTIITTLRFEPDEPIKDHCGSCHKCIDACPTGAITGPYQLDARRCLAYLSIEHKGSIPEAYRRAMGDRVFGCDECLDVCPWVRWAKTSHEAKFSPTAYPDLRDTLYWDEHTFWEHFQGTPIMRLKLRRWKRNVCVVLGNIGDEQDISALEQIASSEDEMLGEHAQWAIREIQRRHTKGDFASG